MLAALLDWPQALYASKILMERNEAIVTREVDGGLQTIAVELPAVVSVDLRLNTPRYASLPNIMQAKRKPLSVVALTVLALDLAPHQQVLKTMPPAKKPAGMRVNSVEELVDKLRFEAKVIEG